jgi:two-component system sensor histidine kinase BaeS
MIPAQIAIVVFVAILLYAFWRILIQRSDGLRAAPPADHAQPAISTGRRKHADVRQLLAQMAEVLRTRLQAAGMALDLKLPADPLPVLLDRSGMQEVFGQIVEFACRAMRAGSTLRVLGRVEGTHAVINFMDTAPGAAEPRLARCFDTAAAGVARRQGDGETAATGALCMQIVAEHRGRIYAAPSPLGSLGITLRLPLQGAVASVH